MPRGYADFSHPMTRGDTSVMRFTVKDKLTGLAVDITNWSAFRFTAKESVDQADGLALFTKQLGSGITKTFPLTGVCEVQVNPADTSTLLWKEYNIPSDFQGVDAAGSVWTLAKGLLVLDPDVSRTSP